MDEMMLRRILCEEVNAVLPGMIAAYMAGNEGQADKGSASEPGRAQTAGVDLNGVQSFSEYEARLRKQPARFGYAGQIVDPDDSGLSYVIDLEAARQSFATCGSLKAMSSEQRHQIGGTRGRYSYLGNMARQVQFRQMMEDGGSAVEDVSKALDKLPLDGDITLSSIENVVDELCSIKFVKLAVASRLVAMKRPDKCCPITNQ